MNFTIAITTRNRPDSFSRVYKACKKYTDNIIVVDDASDTPYCNANYRFPERSGIPKAKNKCIELFMKTKSQHLFMLDDDTFPIHEDSFKRYIESGEKHLCYTFWNPTRIHGNIKEHRHVNGCMMYFNRCCFDLVGGFDTNYGLGKYEHNDMSRRIHNIGITRFRYQDIVCSDELFYCLDQKQEIARSFSPKECDELIDNGRSYYHSKENSIEYISYD